jgi:hypothetical protein
METRTKQNEKRGLNTGIGLCLSGGIQPSSADAASNWKKDFGDVKENDGNKFKSK